MGEENDKQFWLIKVEPSEYSFKRLQREKETPWDGVRNYQAQQYLKQMRLNDEVLFYHTEDDNCVVGIAEISREYYIKDDPKFGMVNVKYVCWLQHPVNLKAIKNTVALKDMMMIKQSRLSISPLTRRQWDIILEMSEAE